MEQRHVEQVAGLHHACIHSLLSDLGPRLCRQFYRLALRSPNCFGFVDEDGGQVRGYAMGALDNSRLFTGWGLRLALLGALMRRPALLPRLMFHVRGEFAPAPELIYEAVATQFRRQGIATALSRALAEAFRTRGVSRYEIRIDRANEPNLARHRKLGARIVREYQEGGVSRYLLDSTL